MPYAVLLMKGSVSFMSKAQLRVKGSVSFTC